MIIKTAVLLVIFFFCIFLINVPVLADELKEDSVIVSDSLPVADTVIFKSGDLLDNITPVTNPVNMETRLTQNPTGALFKSMFVPGWGQLGNKRRLKAVFFFALDSWMVLSAIHYGRQASDFREQYESIDASDNLILKNEYYALYLDRKDERNKFTWFAVIVSFFSMFDAYVDAHLSGQPKTENIERINLGIVPEAGGAKVQFSVSF